MTVCSVLCCSVVAYQALCLLVTLSSIGAFDSNNDSGADVDGADAGGADAGGADAGDESGGGVSVLASVELGSDSVLVLLANV